MSEQTGRPGDKERHLGLDLLRALAIVLVLGRHLGVPPGQWAAPGAWFIEWWQFGGWVGVDLFFVLSGFLVSGLLFGELRETGRMSAWRFYIRRGWKIYPPYLTLIVVTLLAQYFLGTPGYTLKTLLRELFFVQNYFYGHWHHTWSLAVEEHFYLLLPLLLFGLMALVGLSFRSLALFAAGLCLLLMLLRGRAFLSGRPYDYWHTFFPTHLRLDSLLVGVVIGHAYHFHRAMFERVFRPWRVWLMIGGAALFVPAFVIRLETSLFLHTFGLFLLSVGSAAVLIGTVLTPLPRSWPIAALAAIGAYSYSIYLWHLPIAHWGVPALVRLVGFPGYPLLAMCYLAGSLLVGVLMTWAVETPALWARDRWFPARPRREARERAQQRESLVPHALAG